MEVFGIPLFLIQNSCPALRQLLRLPLVTTDSFRPSETVRIGAVSYFGSLQDEIELQALLHGTLRRFFRERAVERSGTPWFIQAIQSNLQSSDFELGGKPISSS